MLKSRAKPTMIAVKSRLAQLLAAENIKVQHLPVKTAYFILKERILVCPIWKDMDGDLYDLCMGHEVGHALNTPPEGWHGALVQMGRGYQSYMNVVEDARIERKMKTKFPGLRAPFARAYQKLADRDLFEIKKRRIDLDKLALIDRLNLFFKAGHVYPINFTEEERTFITRMENADTWEDVRAIADELYARAKKNKDKLPQTPQNSPQGEQSDGEQGEGEEEQTAQGKSKQKKPKKNKKQEEKNVEDMTPEELADALNNQEADGGDEGEEGQDSSDADGDAEEGDRSEDEDEAANSGQGEDSDEEDEDGVEQGAGDNADGDEDEESDADDGEDSDDGETGADNDSENDEDQEGSSKNADHDHSTADEKPDQVDPTSETDEAFRNNEESLVDDRASGIRVCYLPEGNVNKMILSNEKVIDLIESGIDKAFRDYTTAARLPEQKHHRETFAQMSVREILQKNKKYIDMLVKEFELRKNATDYARQLTAKTGELDLKSLHKYKFTNDLFKKVTNVPKGKSHGMVFFLDMSSSMQEIMGYTVRQLLVLISFCKRVGIPFEVYGFSDCNVDGFRGGHFDFHKPDTLQSGEYDFHLKHLISSRLRGNSYRRAFNALSMYSNIFYGQQSEEIRKYLVVDETAPNYSYSYDSECVHFSERDLGMALGGTPYNKMLLASRDLIEQFKAQSMVDIVNVIHLTDGCGTDPLYAPTTDYSDPNYRALQNSRVAYTDRKTMTQIIDTGAGSQEILTRMVKTITGCRHIAYYVGSAFSIKWHVKHSVEEKNKKEFKKQLADFGFFKIEHLGYDSYYYMEVSQENNAGMSEDQNVAVEKRFIDHQREKMKSRNMARQFASEIAEQIKR